MSWRGSITVTDRILACLPYLLPMVEGVTFGFGLLQSFPPLAIALTPILILWGLYRRVRYAGLIIFFALFIFVVRNEKINHFIRFNTMQAILIDIVLFIGSILMDIVGLTPGSSFVLQTLATTIFIGLVAAVGYSVVQSLMGRYAEIPTISDAVYTQVR